MKKVGIVSCYFKDNYGSRLQAFATKYFLDINNIPNETIKVDNNKDFKKGKRKYYISQLFNFSFISSKFGMIKLKFDKVYNKELRRNISIRTKKYKEFRKEFNYSINCTDYKGLSEITKQKYSDVIVGSDQLWLPVNIVADYYTLNWVPDEVNKISYSTSFGVSTIPQKFNKLYENFLKRINCLSSREESGVKLIDDITGIKAALVCDPTILLTKEQWEKIAEKEVRYHEKYILCYFLGKNIAHRQFAEKLKEKTGYKIVSLNHADEYVKYSDVFADYTPYDIGPKEWINLIKNAEYICTDSFHGSVFSILFNKCFFSFRRHSSKNKNNTNSRLDSLLKVAGISNERILTGFENIDDVLKYKIDYEKVNKNIERFRKESSDWLISSISWKSEKEKSYINLAQKDMCTGCTACEQICPKSAIEMDHDVEGFLYPKVDIDNCIECGLCKKICPVINSETIKFEQKGYIFQNSDTDVRWESTSGGFFTAVANIIIEKQGVVYGVGFDENFSVTHLRAETKEEMSKFRNSKYVQSNPNNTFSQAKVDLDNGRYVLYSGTACQIEGLLNFLGKNYTNLLTVDVICRAVPSPLLWEKYIAFKNHEKNAQIVKFRDKVFGYKYSNFTISDGEKYLYRNGIESDPYLRAFFSNIACRPSCYECKFKNQYHKADFTIWDCFEVEKYDKSFDDDLGTTRVLANTEKAEKIMQGLGFLHKVKEIDTQMLISGFHQMFNSIRYNSSREAFFIDMNSMPIDKVLDKYFPDRFINRLERVARVLLIRMGIYRPLLKLAKKARKRV